MITQQILFSNIKNGLEALQSFTAELASNHSVSFEDWIRAATENQYREIMKQYPLKEITISAKKAKSPDVWIQETPYIPDKILVAEDEKTPGEFLDKLSKAVDELERPVPETIKKMHDILCNFKGEVDPSRYVTIVRGGRVHLISTGLLEEYTNLFAFLDIDILPPKQPVLRKPTGECTWFFEV